MAKRVWKAGKKMPYRRYLWIEDRKGKSGCIFWEILMQNLCPDVIVESKMNNSELVKAVKNLKDQENKYIIVFDNAFDNQQAYQEQKALKNYVSMKNNVWAMDIICFEFILLEFGSLIDWIYASEDELKRKRASAIRAREMLVATIQMGELDYKIIQEIAVYDHHLNGHNIEQLSSKLLYDLTRNTGFEVTKRTIGDCWIKSCCDWSERQKNDICGLDNSRLSVADKMKHLYTETSLSWEFPKAGLEVVL